MFAKPNSSSIQFVDYADKPEHNSRNINDIAQL